MSFEQAVQNEYGFSSVTLRDFQPEVTNDLGRDALPFEIVFLSGYVGEVREYNGIPDTQSGRINIDPNRVIRTAQIKIDDTFAVGATVHFLPGGAGAAGKIVDAAASGSIAFGKVVAFGGTGGAHTYLDVRPFTYSPERTVTP